MRTNRSETRQITIDATPENVLDVVGDARTLPRWAPNFATPVEPAGEHWLANELLTLMQPYGVTATGEGEGGVFMVPLQRLNAIVVFAVDTAAFAEIDRWLLMLDIPADQGAGRQTFVYNVENAKAADLAAVLNELFGGGAGPARGAGGGGAGRGETTGRRTGLPRRIESA